MNMNRLRPTGVAKDQLDAWLAGVILDAIRDAIEAGLDEQTLVILLRQISEMHDPFGRMFKRVAITLKPSDAEFVKRVLDGFDDSDQIATAFRIKRIVEESIAAHALTTDLAR